MVEERAAAFTKRSIKTSAKLAGLKLAISMMDLTTLVLLIAVVSRDDSVRDQGAPSAARLLGSPLHWYSVAQAFPVCV